MFVDCSKKVDTQAPQRRIDDERLFGEYRAFSPAWEGLSGGEQRRCSRIDSHGINVTTPPFFPGGKAKSH